MSFQDAINKITIGPKIIDAWIQFILNSNSRDTGI